MSIIIKCKKCHKILKADVRCPHCGSSRKDFVIDYRPAGRYGPHRQRKLEGVDDYDIALEYDRQMKKSIRDRRNPEIVRDVNQLTATFNDLYEEYLKWCKLRSEDSPSKNKTNRGREYRWTYILKIIGDMPVAHFDKHQVRHYQDARHTDGVGNKTINNELYEVAGFLNWCRSEKDFSMEKIYINKLPHKRPLPMILSREEIVKLIKAAEPFYRAFYLCLYTIGWRYAEVQYLKKSDVDLKNKTLRTIQKGGGWKVSALNPELEKALNAITPKDKTLNPDEYYFISPRTGRPIVDIRKALERHRIKAKIKKNLYPHLLRHSIATHMLQNKTNLRTIQTMLGQADVSTTKWYTHVVTDDIRDATQGMFDDMFSKKPAKVDTKNRRNSS